MGHWDVLIDTEVRDTVAASLMARDGRITLVTGPLGAGKTTLLDAVAVRLADDGYTVFRALAVPELGAVPFGAFASLLAGIEGADASQRLLRLHAVLARPGARHAIVIDDAEQLDAQSAAATVQLLRTSAVRVLAAVEAVALLPPPLARLALDARIDEFPVPALGDTVAAELAERRLGGLVAPESLKHLLVRAQGNPLFLRALLDDAERAGRVTPTSAGRAVQIGEAPVAAVHAVAARFAPLSPQSRRAVELLAASGELPIDAVPFDVRSELERCGLALRRGEWLALPHPLYAEAALAPLTDDETRARRLEAASLLTDPSQAYLAITLRAESSDPPSTAELEWATREALRRADRERVVRLAEIADALAASRGERRPYSSLIARAEALSQAGHLDEAETAYTELLASPLTDAELADAVSRGGFHYGVRRARPEEAVRMAQEARERVTDPAARTWLAMAIARFRFSTGDAITYGDIEPGESESEEFVLNRALLQLQQTVFTGELDVASRAILVGKPLADARPDLVPRAAAAFDFSQFLILLVDGRAADAEAFIRGLRGRPLDESTGLWEYAYARLRLLAGDVEGARQPAARAVAQLAQRDVIGARAPAIALMAAVHAAGGERDEALARLAELGETLRAYPAADLQASEAEAMLLVARGDVDGAEAAILRAAQHALDVSYTTFAALTALSAVRLGRAGSVVGLLRTAAERAPQAGLIPLVLDYAVALAARDAPAVVAAGEALRVGGFLAAAGDAARQAADLARSSADPATVRRAAVLAHSLAGADDRTAADALSPREWAVAQAAAERLRSREIAAQLGLSIRTVDNLLARAYRKLGVSGRDELRAALGAR